MENPVDHSIDLGLVNFMRHPTNPHYIVFRFADELRANSFEAALQENDIWFEKALEESKHKQRTYILFGVHQNNFKAAQRINFQVEAKHKKHIIPNKYFKWSLLIFSIFAVGLSILGYCNRP